MSATLPSIIKDDALRFDSAITIVRLKGRKRRTNNMVKRS